MSGNPKLLEMSGESPARLTRGNEREDQMEREKSFFTVMIRKLGLEAMVRSDKGAALGKHASDVMPLTQ